MYGGHVKVNSQQAMVRQFHHHFGCTVGKAPGIRDTRLAGLLIMEEAVETVAAMGFEVSANVNFRTPGNPNSQTSKENPLNETVHFYKNFEQADAVEAIDGLCDLLYVTYGAGVRFGVDLEPFFAEVHKTNMAKVGGATRPDGKILKPAGWQKPDIAGLLERERRWGEDPSLAEVRHERLLNGERT